jgi:hypothetical protein
MEINKMVRILFIKLCIFLFATSIYADPRLNEVQSWLNHLQLDAGPVNGVLGLDTERALTRFLKHRGIEFDGSFGDEEYREVMGQTNYELPETKGFKLCGPKRFPSVDTYERNPTNPSEFKLTLKKGDYDYNDFRGDTSVYGSDRKNLNSQRAKIYSCNRLAFGKIYTLDFDVSISHVSAGAFFEIHGGGAWGSASIQVWPQSLRFNAGRHIDNVAIFRGDYLNRWVAMRIVFMASHADKMFFRFYVDGIETLDTSGIKTDFGFSKKGGTLHFGPYRGNSSGTASVSYSNIKLSTGDLRSP